MRIPKTNIFETSGVFGLDLSWCSCSFSFWSRSATSCASSFSRWFKVSLASSGFGAMRLSKMEGLVDVSLGGRIPRLKPIVWWWFSWLDVVIITSKSTYIKLKLLDAFWVGNEIGMEIDSKKYFNHPKKTGEPQVTRINERTLSQLSLMDSTCKCFVPPSHLGWEWWKMPLLLCSDI